MNYYNKYIKYKNKYFKLKNKINNDNNNDTNDDLANYKISCKKIDTFNEGNIKIFINKLSIKYNPNDLKCLACLNLSMKNIVGELNEPKLFNLFGNLQELDLSHNKLNGNVDLLTFPSTLKKLNLSNNLFTGEFNNIDYLSNIEYLNISYNYLNFNFNKLFELEKLIYLDISHNNINYEIVSMIPGLENAEFVRYGVMHRNTFINSSKLTRLFLLFLYFYHLLDY